MEHNFPFGYSGWEFWTTSHVVPFIWKFSGQANQKSLTINNPPEISGYFGKWLTLTEMLDFLEIPRATQSRRPPHVAFQDLIQV